MKPTNEFDLIDRVRRDVEMKNIKNIFLIVIMIFCLILVGCGNKEKNVSKNILDTSTEEYQKVIIAIVSLAYSEDEMPMGTDSLAVFISKSCLTV